MAILKLIFEITGSLALILYGMKLMSDGIQKSAGEGMHTVLNFMTKNRVMAVMTGVLVTAIVQSSSATTVMTVSFVNAGILTLKQAIGVIFGANIGTTITAWIVSLIGFSFKLTALAIPVFGIGYFLTFFKRFNKVTLGEALMGFGLLFMGLGMLSGAAPNLKTDDLAFLSFIKSSGPITVLGGVLFGLVVTVILHSSSAAMAVLITLAHNGVIGWEFSAACVLGSNIGTTIDAILASIGTKLNARRAAAVHVLFNVFGTLIALILFRPFLYLVHSLFLTGSIIDNIATRISLFHTLFNVFNTLIATPFVNQIEALVTRLIKPSEDDDDPERYVLNIPRSTMKENTEAYILRGKTEILRMSSLVKKMFKLLNLFFTTEKRRKKTGAEIIEKLAAKEDLADQMHEEISGFLIHLSHEPLSQKSEKNIRLMLGIVDDIESITDRIYELGFFVNRSITKKMPISKSDMEKLQPYMGIVTEFVHFVHGHLNEPLAPEQFEIAERMEQSIDDTRQDLKRLARNRLEKGANVKAELLYMDMVRNLEKIGDYAFSISRALAEMD